MANHKPGFIGVKAAAKMLDVHPARLNKLIELGEIRVYVDVAHGHRAFKVVDLEEYMNRGLDEKFE
jgi:hypothetical protein